MHREASTPTPPEVARAYPADGRPDHRSRFNRGTYLTLSEVDAPARAPSGLSWSTLRARDVTTGSGSCAALGPCPACSGRVVVRHGLRPAPFVPGRLGAWTPDREAMSLPRIVGGGLAIAALVYGSLVAAFAAAPA